MKLGNPNADVSWTFTASVLYENLNKKKLKDIIVFSFFRKRWKKSMKISVVRDLV